MEGRYSIAAAVWDSTGRGHRGREGEDTCISKFVVCLQWRNLPFSALHTLIMTCSTISQPEWPEREEFDSLQLQSLKYIHWRGFPTALIGLISMATE